MNLDELDVPDRIREPATELLLWIAEGKTARAWLRSRKERGLTPTHVESISEYRRNHPSFAKLYAEARDIGFDAIAESTLDIVDTEPQILGNGGYDSGHVAWMKLRAWQRMQLLSKWSPNRYGDRVQHVGENGGPVVQRIERVIVGRDGSPRTED